MSMDQTINDIAKNFFEKARAIAESGEKDPRMDAFHGIIGEVQLTIKYFPHESLVEIVGLGGEIAIREKDFVVTHLSLPKDYGKPPSEFIYEVYSILEKHVDKQP